MISPCFGVVTSAISTLLREQSTAESNYFFFSSSLPSSRARSTAGTEVVHLEKLADLDFAFLAFVGSGDALGPFDRLFPGLHLNDPVSGDEFLGLGEGAVDDGALDSRELDAGALGARRHRGVRRLSSAPRCTCRSRKGDLRSA